ncbi:MAG: lysoplasmalogenase [Bacteroidetes bacterium]|nr:MAG: lysoplasmalogenase [Bacteroidota bacterium]
MSTADRIFSLCFFVIALLQIASNFLKPVSPAFHYAMKPAIMLSLGVYFLFQSRGKHPFYTALMTGAILASLAGDVLLMLPGDYFVWGLAAFLLAHLCYIGVFSRFGLHHTGQPALLRQHPWIILFFLIYAAGLLLILYPGLEGMFIPVVIYAVVIMGMALAALNRWQKVERSSFAFVFLGALLFMLSDSMIAINRFACEIPFSHLWIMLTYMGAQYFIVMGILKQYRSPHASAHTTQLPF